MCPYLRVLALGAAHDQCPHLEVNGDEMAAVDPQTRVPRDRPMSSQ